MKRRNRNVILIAISILIIVCVVWNGGIANVIQVTDVQRVDPYEDGFLMQMIPVNNKMKVPFYLDERRTTNTTRFNAVRRPTGTHRVTLADAILSNTTHSACELCQRLVFLKTHKTGSSTLTSIFQVYGLWRNLTFAVPKTGAQILSSGFFKVGQVHPGKYDMLVNHVRYNRTGIDMVMKYGAKYITILRDATTQVESNFGYFTLARYLNLTGETNPFRTFVSNPSYYWNKYKHFPFRDYLKNPSLHDLGLSQKDQGDLTKVQRFIEKISREFDLVLIQEYFNESLLLLRKLMCWTMDDILYLSKGKRSSKIRYDIEPSLRTSIRKWSWADALLYDHFNRSLWTKINDYGPSFQADLAEFEFKLNQTLYNCTLPNVARENRREASIKRNSKGDPRCKDMLMSDLNFTKRLRRIQYGNDSDVAS